MADTVSVTQADREAAENWRFIECRHCSEYGGDFVNDLAEDFARHRLASTQPTPAFPREEVAKLIENIRVAVTYQYMPMSVRMLLSQAVSALSTLSPSAPNTPAPTEATESECLREALARMVYEATHLSPCKPNGDHDCTIKADALAMARAALLQGKQP